MNIRKKKKAERKKNSTPIQCEIPCEFVNFFFLKLKLYHFCSFSSISRMFYLLFSLKYEREQKMRDAKKLSINSRTLRRGRKRYFRESSLISWKYFVFVIFSYIFFIPPFFKFLSTAFYCRVVFVLFSLSLFCVAFHFILKCFSFFSSSFFVACFYFFLSKKSRLNDSSWSRWTMICPLDKQ